ncbi:MAG: argininosuccinate synthase [Elusimicrobia bacterium]|nr:argininosuccinate synthase [Candidatus Liberimonas magnetica]
MSNVKKIVVAYSGGLDTSVILKWLQETYKAEVIACAVDVGQGKEIKPLKEKALKTGASKAYIIDAKKEFVTDYIYPALKANAVYEGKYLLGTSLARPIIAEKVVEVAKKEKADAVCHGATGKGNDQVRFELAFKALMPHVKIIAPWREWSIRSRNDAMDYAKKHGIQVPVTKAKPYSSDANLWHISYEGGILEDPNKEYDETMFQLTVSPQKAPNKPAYITVDFIKGIPVAVNGRKLGAVELIQTLNRIAGANGVGRVDIVENRLVGMKSRGVYEAPAATVLLEAHRYLESICLDKETSHYKSLISEKYAELVYNGQWFTPLREAFDAFIERTQKKVSGTVKLKLYKGNLTVAGRKSQNSLYWEKLATFNKDDIYNQKDAEGFINLFGLPIKVEALLNRGNR